MKSFILISLFLISFGEISVDKENMPRAWWKTLLADAGGALGGAGSVASLCPLCPPIAEVGGAILGGAAASLAMVANPGGVVDTSWFVDTNSIIEYSLIYPNDSSVGNKHNEIIKGFQKTGQPVTAINFYNYILSLDDNIYNQTLKVLKLEYFENEFQLARSISSEEQLYSLISERLPNRINKVSFISDLENLLNSSRINFDIVEMESKFRSQVNDPKDVVMLESFFSTLKYSNALWVN